ncbi:MAG: hypothetical protein AAF993_05905 [Pseudomonadota bacterium]
MINCMCVIQAGQAPDQQRAALATALNRFAGEFLHEQLTVNWVPVPAGNGFTAGEPSTSSVVSLTAPEALSQTRRETLLRELVSLWTRQTGCSVDEIVAVIADPVQH